jgi:glycopeptide antibiotics resistance protein
MTRWRIALVLWLLVILVVTTMPWRDFDGRPHWDRIQWVPFPHVTTWGWARWKEKMANVALFVPFGFFATRARNGRGLRAGLFIGGMGLCLSIIVEFFQVFTVHRFPTITDVCTNTFGTICGVILAHRWGKSA